ncbi:MAG: hypothetical protein JJT94_11980, partial [Bernardetiaceae bacterium]|nr:hypothetical protein [Bernardetiaceae bacterium]
RSTLEPSEIFKGFVLKSFRDYSYEEFLESEHAEEVIMAVLADFGEETREAVVRKILTRLSQLKSDKTALNKYVRQLLILARLRNQLPNIIQNELGNMGTIGYDIEQDELYLKGEIRGEKKAQVAIALACLADGLSISKTAKLTGLSKEQVQKLKDEMEKE